MRKIHVSRKIECIADCIGEPRVDCLMAYDKDKLSFIYNATRFIVKHYSGLNKFYNGIVENYILSQWDDFNLDGTLDGIFFFSQQFRFANNFKK